MAQYKALVSFAGKVSMCEGEIKDIDNPIIEKDLLDARYIEEIPSSSPKEKTEPKKRTKKKTTPKGG